MTKMPKRVSKATAKIQKKRYYDKFRLSDPLGKIRYTAAETDLIKYSPLPDRRLAYILHRSLEGIQIKRSRLKNGRDN